MYKHRITKAGPINVLNRPGPRRRGVPTWVAEQETAMTAGGPQLPGARLATRVGHQPGVVRGVHLLAAEAAVLGQPLSAAVLLAALGAAMGAHRHSSLSHTRFA